MIKGILHFFVFTAILFTIHKFFLLSNFDIPNTVPVLFQHLLLGGFSILIYAITDIVSKNFFNYAGFAVLGFLVLKMIFVAIFVIAYEVEIKSAPIIKYVLIGFYFTYLVFLLLKIVPLINVDMSKKPRENS